MNNRKYNNYSSYQTQNSWEPPQQRNSGIRKKLIVLIAVAVGVLLVLCAVIVLLVTGVIGGRTDSEDNTAAVVAESVDTAGETETENPADSAAEETTAPISDIDWTVDGTVLVISGTGDMNTLKEDGADIMPWCDDCESITKAVIEPGVTTICGYAFAKCSALTSVEIPDSVTTICDYAFFGCSKLTKIEIPNGVTSIGDDVFEACALLRSITIPDSLKTIGERAFTYCDSLADVYYAGSESDWDAIEIENYNECLADAEIHYDSSAPAENEESGYEEPTTDEEDMTYSGDQGEESEGNDAEIPATDMVTVIPDESEKTAEYYVRCNGDMRIRSGPGLDYDEITMVTEARLLVIATREVYEPSLDYGNTWGYVQYFDNGGGYGWCYLGFAHAE